MLIIFVYATILFVYYILLKYHIPINSSHQNSSKSCFGRVLLSSPLSRTQLRQEGTRAGSNLESESSGWPRQGGLLRVSPGLQRKRLLHVEKCNTPLLDKESPTPQPLQRRQRNSQLVSKEQFRFRGRENSFPGMETKQKSSSQKGQKGLLSNHCQFKRHSPSVRSHARCSLGKMALV